MEKGTLSISVMVLITCTFIGKLSNAQASVNHFSADENVDPQVLDDVEDYLEKDYKSGKESNYKDSTTTSVSQSVNTTARTTLKRANQITANSSLEATSLQMRTTYRPSRILLTNVKMDVGATQKSIATTVNSISNKIRLASIVPRAAGTMERKELINPKILNLSNSVKHSKFNSVRRGIYPYPNRQLLEKHEVAPEIPPSNETTSTNSTLNTTKTTSQTEKTSTTLENMDTVDTEVIWIFTNATTKPTKKKPDGDFSDLGIFQYTVLNVLAFVLLLIPGIVLLLFLGYFLITDILTV